MAVQIADLLNYFKNKDYKKIETMLSDKSAGLSQGQISVLKKSLEDVRASNGKESVTQKVLGNVKQAFREGTPEERQSLFSGKTREERYGKSYGTENEPPRSKK